MKPITHFNKEFGAENVDLEVITERVNEQDLLVKAKGDIKVQGITFKVTLSYNEAADYPIRGTLSGVDPLTNKVMISEMKKREKKERAKREKKSEPLPDRCFYSSMDFKLKTRELSKVVVMIKEKIGELFSQDAEQYLKHLSMLCTPDTIPPIMAARNYAPMFLANAFPGSSGNPRRKKALIKYYSIMPEIPMKEYSQKMMTGFLKEHNVTDRNAELLERFWRYCLATGICVGRLPFPQTTKPKKVPRTETLNKRAEVPETMDISSFREMFRLMSKAGKYSAAYCVVALLASGFELDVALAATWGDIQFFAENDLATFRYFRPELAGSMHDFTRVLVPEAAAYLRRHYDNLAQAISPEELKCRPIAADENGKVLTAIDIKNIAYNLLIRAGVPEAVLKCAANGKNGVAGTVLRKSYVRYLSTECGLANDEDALYFLQGKKLASSSYTNYISHTDEDAIRHYYTLLKPLSAERKLVAPAETEARKMRGETVFRPATTHEAIHISGKIRLKPGETISIQCLHGMEGLINVREIAEEQ